MLEAAEMYAEELRNSEASNARLFKLSGIEFAQQSYFSATMQLRNRWKLWDRDSALVKNAVATYGLVHADDLSGLIVRGGLAKYRDRDYISAIEDEAIRYKAFWRGRGLNPATMEPLPK